MKPPAAWTFPVNGPGPLSFLLGSLSAQMADGLARAGRRAYMGDVSQAKTANSEYAPMVFVRGGGFRMGSEDFYPDERPVRDAQVGDFWVDVTSVTNAAFARFVAETGYVTVAETAPDPAHYPGMPSEMAQAGSIVFTPPAYPVDLNGPPVWWTFVFGASWRAPLGPGSGIAEIMDHPVVHIAYADALAYAAWADKSLPTEAEWEYAARGGLEGRVYPWGDEFQPGGRRMAKTWEGNFPYRNLAAPDRQRTSPVGSYPPNGFGLYDMAGNVWEWTADRYEQPRPDGARCCGGGRSEDIETGFPQHVTKGGSHLCAANYCHRYRPAARWPQTVDTSISHLGFRCIRRV